jgi:peptide/nickel transport system substrate-binding protein
MRRRTPRTSLGLVGLLATCALLAACGGSSSTTSTGTTSASAAQGSYSTGSATRGGTYSVGYENSFGFTDNFDPTGEYLGDAWGILDNLMIRPLIGYQHVAGASGNKLIGDLAQAVPQPTDNGLTYTYKLRPGVKFGPPVNRAVTSSDVAYALSRLANPKDGGQYAFYFSVVKGWNDFANGKAPSISGITTPDASTLVVQLTQPTGDFNYRMSLPATAPIPPEVGKCFENKPGDYGRDVISSGPYMIAGAAGTFTSCASLQPFSGYAGANGNHLTLVRNPNYDQSTDAVRKNYPAQFQFTIDSNADDIYARVQSGALDDEISSTEPKTLRQYATSANLKPLLHVNSGDRTWYLTMNLTQPPFDDIHVREALNYVIDKQALRKAWGGALTGSIATGIVPPNLFDGGLATYDPYSTPNDAGSLQKAQAAMKQSKYDPGKTGTCTAAACKGVLMIADTRALDNRMVPVIVADAKKIGITFTVRAINGAYTTIQTTNKNIPFSERPGWGKDYADPYTFFGELFDGRALIPSGNTNYSLVGITPQINKAQKLGVTGDLAHVPSIDSDVTACQTLTGGGRLPCWENLDKKLMTQVVPWVPFLWSNVVKVLGPNVTQWKYDQFTDTTAYSQVAVKAGT